MKYSCTVLSVADINAARRFYEDLFGLEIQFDFGINISFTCGISLQQEFDWLVNIPKDQIQKKTNNIELCFEEERFDDFLKKLKEYPDIVYIGAVFEHSWGQRVIRFYDLDWHMIEVGESMRSVVSRFLSRGLSIEETAKRTQHPIDFVKACAE